MERVVKETSEEERERTTSTSLTRTTDSDSTTASHETKTKLTQLESEGTQGTVSPKDHIKRNTFEQGSNDSDISLSALEGLEMVYSREHPSSRAVPMYLKRFGEESELGEGEEKWAREGEAEAKEGGLVGGRKKKANLGGMLGVFLPNIQNIFGVLMFLRLGWIVGVMGITHAFIMVFLCCSCTFLTSISMSAIATNGVVESGGSYFMISRNLGSTVGTAVGVLFYFANTIATSMYLCGGVEILLVYLAPDLCFLQGTQQEKLDTSFFGQLTNQMRLYGTCLLLLLLGMVLMGVKLVQSIAPFTLVTVIVSIISVYVGAIVKSTPDALVPVLCMHHYDNRSVLLIRDQPAWYVKRSARINDTLCREKCSGILNGTKRACGVIYCEKGVTGFDMDTFRENARPHYMYQGESMPHYPAKQGEVFQDLSSNFFLLMGIYFPSVTGIMTGSNMSGDLKDAQGSIPKGTIGAQVVTTIVYLSFVLIFGGTIKGSLLRDKLGWSIGSTMVVAELLAPFHLILLLGAFTSTIGAALQSLCSAPRILQSIAKDNVIPFLSVFQKTNCIGEPMNGLFLSTGIALVFVMLGTVEKVAPVLDSFFLLCYGFTNFACALNSFLGTPNWRPRFKYYHWTFSVLGCVVCFFCFLGNFYAHPKEGGIAIAVCAPVFIYVSWKGNKREWGYGVKGMYLSVNADTRRKLMGFGLQMWAGKGLAMVGSLLEGDTDKLADREKAEELKKQISQELLQKQLPGFVIVLLHNKLELATTVSVLIQSAGLGSLKPNTLVIGWPATWREEQKEFIEFLDRIQRGTCLDMCLTVPIGLGTWPEEPVGEGTIDIWWILIDGGLMLLLGYLFLKSKVWSDCRLRLFAVLEEKEGEDEMKQELEKFLYKIRIDAQVIVVSISKDFDSSLYTSVTGETQTQRKALLKKMDITDQKHLKKYQPEKVLSRSKHSPTSSLEGNVPQLAKESSAMRKHKKFHSAAILNKEIRSHSINSKLVILSLPKPPKKPKVEQYMELIEEITHSLHRVLLVRGSGKEFVTIYS